MKIKSIGVAFFLLSLNVSSKEVETGGLEGEIFRAVMQDTLAQFNYHRSQTEFLFPEYQREETFFKSFGNKSYQGIIYNEEMGKIEYVTENAIIVWNTRSSKIKDSGRLDMNQFVYNHHPSLMLSGENRFVCGGLCIGAIGIGIGAAACTIWNSQCNDRCESLTCPVGSTKVCESSCATGYCGTACQHMNPDLLSNFNAPWSGGAWNSYPFMQWNEFQLDDDPSGGSGPVLIGH